jgi:Heterokaryon incompatibility protein (HET)
MNSLPKSFQDAVTVTRKLYIHSLWIDSLCIIQDSHEDWERANGVNMPTRSRHRRRNSRCKQPRRLSIPSHSSPESSLLPCIPHKLWRLQRKYILLQHRICAPKHFRRSIYQVRVAESKRVGLAGRLAIPTNAPFRKRPAIWIHEGGKHCAAKHSFLLPT